jgi:hypothetical protein
MRLRRKNAEPDPVLEKGDAENEAQAEDGPSGPLDVSDVDLDASYVDLGSQLVQPPDGLDLRQQVDEQSGTVMTVLLVADEGVL